MTGDQRAIINTVTRLVAERRTMQHWAREIVDWIEADGALYDPVRDRFSVQLPGDLVRRLRALTEA